MTKVKNLQDILNSNADAKLIADIDQGKQAIINLPFDIKEMFRDVKITHSGGTTYDSVWHLFGEGSYRNAIFNNYCQKYRNTETELFLKDPQNYNK